MPTPERITRDERQAWTIAATRCRDKGWAIYPHESVLRLLAALDAADALREAVMRDGCSASSDGCAACRALLAYDALVAPRGEGGTP